MTGDEQMEQAESDMEPAGAGAPPAHGANIIGTLSPGQVVAAARAVVRELEPEELPVFNAVADSWLRGDLKRVRPVKSPGASAGFGVEEVLLGQLAFPIITAAAGEVLASATRDGFLARWRARRRPAAEVQPASLTPAQARALHAALQRHARKLGLSPARAELLADAVIGSLTAHSGE